MDAALATAAALTVVDPANNGVGGDCFAIVSMKGEKLAGLNPAVFPGAADAGARQQEGFDRIPNRHAAVTVPGRARGWRRCTSAMPPAPWPNCSPLP